MTDSNAPATPRLPELGEHTPRYGELVKIVDATPPPPPEPVKHYTFATRTSKVFVKLNDVVIREDSVVFKEDRGPGSDISQAKQHAEDLAEPFGVSELVWVVVRDTTHTIRTPSKGRLRPDGKFCRFCSPADATNLVTILPCEIVWTYQITEEGPVESPVQGA